MKKAFFFDMDGVLADTETEWDRLGYDDLLKRHFGEELFNQVEVNSGTSIKSIFDNFVKVGWLGDYQAFHDANIEMGEQIYHSISLTPGVEELIDYLSAKQFVIGVVSSSPLMWVETLTSRLKNKSNLSHLISVNNHETLLPKPAPDPYLYAMKQVGVSPNRTIVLEDSQTGVTASKSAGATTICFTGHHHGHDWQVMPKDADFYAGSMKSVQEIVAKLELN